MKVVILGRTEYLYETAELLASGHEICAIVTAKAMPEYSKTEDDFKRLAHKLDCPFYFTGKTDSSLIEKLNQLNADICVSLNWINVLKDDIIGSFKHGILNAHFGDLPSYRGNAVINWAILKREKQIAVTIHKMVPGEIDSGNILKKKYMPIDSTTSIGNIVDFCRENTPQLFLETVNEIADGRSEEIPQNTLPQKAFRCYPRLPEYSKIDWKQSAEEIDALVRASAKPYSGAYSYMKINSNIQKVYIWRSSIDPAETNDIGEPGNIIKNDPETGMSKVLTGKGILNIEEVQYAGNKIFQPGKVWKSIRLHFGIDIEEEIMNIYKLLKKS